ncbi:MAG: aspartate carbamoyltransferase catalytic subunit [Actinobacteria bacterium]|nr:aspartate carbamoyltransferase catalytic subunit [Actinomycetota bacterium]
MKHLLSIDELGLDGLNALLNLTDHMVEINQRPVPKVPALRGRTVASLFFEDSTRTRLSFETAAKRLSADTMTFNVSTSSVNKGESLRDTVATITDMGVDVFVVRHKSVGIPWQISEWTKASIINAGDGAHQHPTQALVDCYTIREATHAKSFSGMRMVIVGDIKHSRVARSNIQAFSMLGAAVTLVAPPTLLPPDVSHWPVAVSHDLDEVLPQTDVLYMLRLQSERMSQGHVPTLREYSEQYGLTQKRVMNLQAQAIVMHPGPMNRGVEMQIDPSDVKNSLIHRQVANGVAVRMAVLFELLGSGSNLAGQA